MNESQSFHQPEQLVHYNSVLPELVIDALGALVVILDSERRVVRFNRKAEEVTGRTEAQLLGKSVFATLVPEDDRDHIGEIFREIEKQDRFLDFERDLVNTQGRRYHIQWRNTVLRDSRGNIAFYIGTGIDVTAHYELQEKLLHSQKLESLGRLAGGIAHDYNNILTIIQGYAERALMFIGPESKATRELDRLLEGVKRCADLNQQLLTFARKQKNRPQPVNLNELSERVTYLLNDVLGPNVRLETDLEENCPEVLGDRGQLERILMNLTLNARDAMPEGGSIRVRTGSAALDEERARMLQVRPGLYTVLRVEDDGIGIPPDQIDKIFEPFFTTKALGKGTGLGLAVCEGIARQSKGAIAVESEQGRGTTFTLYLPARG